MRVCTSHTHLRMCVCVCAPRTHACMCVCACVRLAHTPTCVCVRVCTSHTHLCVYVCICLGVCHNWYLVQAQRGSLRYYQAFCTMLYWGIAQHRTPRHTSPLHTTDTKAPLAPQTHTRALTKGTHTTMKAEPSTQACGSAMYMRRQHM